MGHQPTEESRKQFQAYFDASTFLAWDDLEPPVIGLSDDGTLAYVVAHKRVAVKPKDAGDETPPEETIFAWLETWRKVDGAWKLEALASTSMPGVESNEARAYVSPADASVSTWLGYDTPVAFGISYYTQGQNVGALLDLSIRHDTEGRASLDDVMRALYTDFYGRGRGFSTEDQIGVVNGLTKGDYADFHRAIVDRMPLTQVPNHFRIGAFDASFDRQVPFTI